MENGPQIDFQHIVIHAVGENAGLREINEKDRVDLARMWEIEKSEGMVDWISESSFSKKSELVRFIRALNKTAENSGVCHLYGVTAQEDRTTHNLLPSNERGEIEGWLRTDETRQESERFQRLMGCTLSQDVPPPIELTYIKRKAGPAKLMASAVRQVCMKILQEDNLREGAVEERVDPKGKEDAKIIPKRPIMLFVDRDNMPSETVALDAGFEKVRENVSWKTSDEPRCNMYVLDNDTLWTFY